MEIKRSTIKGAGKGLFAARQFRKRTRLGEYKGRRLTPEEYQRTRNDDYIWEIDLPGGKRAYIDARPVKRDNPLRYVNGARTRAQKRRVNVEAYQYAQRIWYRTTKDVKPGEEFLIDYGDEYF